MRVAGHWPYKLMRVAGHWPCPRRRASARRRTRPRRRRCPTVIIGIIVIVAIVIIVVIVIIILDVRDGAPLSPPSTRARAVTLEWVRNQIYPYAPHWHDTT